MYALISDSRSNNFFSDVDPDPVGFTPIWVCGSGSGSRGYKMKEKAEFNQLFLGGFFRGNYIFQA